ncbi:hypothetical protein NC651_013646 [Populus alba x Populus x berolinensis]|nr:hypothetical protein NC651_013646 [Populus alba x Populus x berolinensis]
MHNALIQRSESCLMSLAKETCAGPQIAFNHDA